MTNPTEINRFLATEVMEKCWHEWDIKKDWDDTYVCTNCSLRTNGIQLDNGEHPNPDYLTNLSDRQDLLEWLLAKEQTELLEDFMLFIQQDEPAYNEYSFPIHLLKDVSALATAIYRYLKG